MVQLFYHRVDVDPIVEVEVGHGYDEVLQLSPGRVLGVREVDGPALHRQRHAVALLVHAVKGPLVELGGEGVIQGSDCLFHLK